MYKVKPLHTEIFNFIILFLYSHIKYIIMSTENKMETNDQQIVYACKDWGYKPKHYESSLIYICHGSSFS
jgi:ABC-type spermidine/putrescine transport system permease subunit I